MFFAISLSALLRRMDLIFIAFYGDNDLHYYFFVRGIYISAIKRIKLWFIIVLDSVWELMINLRDAERRRLRRTSAFILLYLNRSRLNDPVLTFEPALDVRAEPGRVTNWTFVFCPPAAAAFLKLTRLGGWNIFEMEPGGAVWWTGSGCWSLAVWQRKLLFVVTGNTESSAPRRSFHSLPHRLSLSWLTKHTNIHKLFQSGSGCLCEGVVKAT